MKLIKNVHLLGVWQTRHRKCLSDIVEDESARRWVSTPSLSRLPCDVDYIEEDERDMKYNHACDLAIRGA